MNIDNTHITPPLTESYRPVVREDIADKKNLTSSVNKITSNNHDIMLAQKKEGETSNEARKNSAVENEYIQIKMGNKKDSPINLFLTGAYPYIYISKIIRAEIDCEKKHCFVH